MVITPQNTDVAILANIVSTLQQIKVSGVPNQRLAINHSATNVTLNCYADAAHTILVFSDNTVNNIGGGTFTIAGGKTFYVPIDANLNAAEGLSTTMAQPIYYVVADFSDDTSIDVTYDNSANLMFSRVIVASKKDPAFTTNANMAIVVPGSRKNEKRNESNDSGGERIYVTLTWDIYIQLLVYNYDKLSEQARQAALSNAANIMTDALYYDPSRGGLCSQLSRNLEQTFVDTMKPLPFVDVLKGCMTVSTGHVTYPTTY